MTSFLIYDLKVGALIAVCYVLYRLLLERDTAYHVSRLVLLTSVLLALVLPLCTVTLHQTVVVEETAAGTLPADADGIAVQAGRYSFEHLLATFFTIVIIIGALIRLAMLARYCLLLQRLISTGHCRRQPDGTVLCIVDAPVPPFSWWRTVVISRTDYESSAAALFLIHERSHIRLRHSADVVFVELLTALQWFNPVAWLLSRDLRTIHEYEADEAVLSQGAGTARYITLLILKATGVQACALANRLSTNNLKKRIDMMKKPKTDRRWSWLKALYVIPVAAIALTATAKTVTNYQVVPAEENAPAPMLQQDDPVFNVCEVLPQYPGGETALLEFLMKSMKYPTAASNFGVQGRVLAQFIVEKDGSISNIRALRVTDPSTGNEVVVTAIQADMTDEQQKKNAEGHNAGLQALKDEAVRVVKLMPKWTPGKQQGKAVRVKFTIPVTFRLN